MILDIHPNAPRARAPGAADTIDGATPRAERNGCIPTPPRPSHRRVMRRGGGRLRAAVIVGVVGVGALCALTAAPASARELTNYPALVDALMAGQSVTTLLDLALCKRDGGDAPGPKVRGGLRITRFLIPNGQYVAFADTHHTLDTEDRPVVEYIRYRALPDGTATVRFARQTGNSGEAAPRGQYLCRYREGIRFIAGEAPRPLPVRARLDAPGQAPVQDGQADAQQPAQGGDTHQ